jgi:hypothetical protein
MMGYGNMLQIIPIITKYGGNELTCTYESVQVIFGLCEEGLFIVGDLENHRRLIIV